MKPDDNKPTNNTCRQCSLCVGSCPIFSVYREEPISAKGRVILGDTNVSTDETSDLIWECRVCGLCQSVCPPQIPHTKNTLALRKKLISDDRISEDVRLLKERLRKHSTPFGEKPRKQKKRNGKVLIWTGCTARSEAPEIIEASLKFFEKVGIDAALLESEECCGAVDYFLGDEKAARERLKKLLPIFAEFNEVISLCSTCWVYFNKGIPRVTEKKDRRSKSFPRIRHLLNIVYERSEIIKLDTSAFFHFPCRMANLAGKKHPSSADNMVQQMGFRNSNIECTGQVLCCGGNCYKDALVDLSQWRIPQILQGFDGNEVVTACPGCYINFKKNSGRNVKFVTSLC